MSRVHLPHIFSFLILCLALTAEINAKHAYTAMGEKSYASGNFDNAVKYFQMAIEAGETGGEPQFFIGSILESKRKYSESIGYFAAAVARPLKPQYRNAALWKLVFFHHRLKDYEKTLEYVELMNKAGIKTDQLDKIRTDCENQLTPSKKEAAKLVKEIQKLEIELNEAKNEYRNSGGKNIKQFHFQKKALVEQIIEKTARAVEFNEDHYAYALSAALLCESLDRYDDALNFYVLLKKKEPENPNYDYKLGVIAKNKRQYEQAIAILDPLAKTAKDTKLRNFSLLNLAQAQIGQEKYPQAMNILQKHAKELKSLSSSTYLPALCLSQIQQRKKISKQQNLALDNECKQIIIQQSKNLEIAEESANVNILIAAHWWLYNYQKSKTEKENKNLQEYAEKAEKLLQKALFRFEKKNEFWQIAAISESLTDAHWLIEDLPDIVNFLLEIESTKAAAEVLEYFPFIFSKNPEKHFELRASLLFQEKNYTEFLELLQANKDYGRNLQREFLIALAKTQQYDRLLGIMEKLKTSNSKISQGLKEMLEKSEIFTEFRQSDSYQKHVNQNQKKDEEN